MTNCIRDVETMHEGGLPLFRIYLLQPSRFVNQSGLESCDKSRAYISQWLVECHSGLTGKDSPHIRAQSTPGLCCVEHVGEMRAVRGFFYFSAVSDIAVSPLTSPLCGNSTPVPTVILL